MPQLASAGGVRREVGLAVSTSTLPIVVVGAGTAGSTVAAHLAHATSRDIVVVEPGRSSTHDDEPRFFTVMAHSEWWPIDGYQQPRVIGGGSAVNGLILSGDVPEHLESLTRIATTEDMGPAARALLAAGGRPARLWWNRGRWNPGRVIDHLVDEGRIQLVRAAADRIDTTAGRARAVITSDGEIEADHIVVCAGALLTPALLLRSGLDKDVPAIGEGLQNHPALALVFHALAGSGRFDASVLHEVRTSNDRLVTTIAYERASHTDDDVGLLMSMLMDVESRGRVLWEDGQLRCDFGELSTPGDRVAFTEMEERLRDLAEECGLMMHGLPSATMVSHATSSCSRSVDGRGRLLGVDAVTLADASILPSVPSVTPAAPVTMEARRIADILREELA